MNATNYSLTNSEYITYKTENKFYNILYLKNNNYPNTYDCSKNQYQLSNNTYTYSKKTIKNNTKTSYIITNDHNSYPNKRIYKKNNLSNYNKEPTQTKMYDNLNNNYNGNTNENLNKPTDPNNTNNVPTTDNTLNICKNSLKMYTNTNN